MQALTVFNSDNAFLTDFFHGFGNDVADFMVRVSRNSADLSNFLAGSCRLAERVELFDGSCNSFVDTAFQIHRAHTGGNILHAFVNDGLSQNSSGRCTVSGVVAGLGSNFLNHLSAHVFKLVFQFNFFCNRNTVFSDSRAAESAFENNVAAFRSESYFNGIGKNVNAVDHTGTSVIAEQNLFCCHLLNLLFLNSVLGRLTRGHP